MKDFFTHQRKLSALLFSGLFLLCGLILVDYIIKKIVLAEGIFYLCNTGVAFGLSLSPPLLLLSWTVLITTLVILLYKNIHKKRTLSTLIPYIFIISGGIGNLIDRLQYGCVVDYIPFFHFSLFNFADFFITLGALLLIVKSKKL